MLRKILLVLVVVIIVLAIVVAMQPSEFTVQRSAVVPASPATVFPMVNDFRRWDEWSPWDKIDPQMKRTFSGPEAGKGAKYAWVGNNDVGEGDMTITESKPNELILIDLHFVKPMEGTSLTEFKFTPEGEGTRVSWKMTGTNNFVGKAMCLVMDMDKMIGGKFDEGLNAMKANVAAPRAAGSSTPSAVASPTPPAAGS